MSDLNTGDLVVVARAVRTRGLKGEVVADLLTDFPERFEDVDQLIGRAADGQRQILELEDYWFQKGRVILKFKDYDDVDKADELVGYEFGVPEDERVELEEDEYYDWELEGCVVQLVDQTVLGRVQSVLRTGGTEILSIKADDGREVLVPLAADIVIEIDVPAKKIVIDPPAGLLEL